MDSILEKITLYDVLGYMLPGSLVMLAVSGKFLISAYTYAGGIDFYQDHEKLFVYGFILLSYICGILVSEMSRMIMGWGRKKKGQEENPTTGNFPIPDKRIKKALKIAGIIDYQDGEISIVQYLKQMYSDIQSDKEYRRIHNYASAEVMYKNLALAIPISAILLCTYYPDCIWGKVIVLVSGFIGMWISGMRCKRFCRKKQEYTVCWYVEKYLGRK